jgi:ketosteroid isomerase-like protein
MRNIFLILLQVAIFFSCNQNKNPSSELTIAKTKEITIPKYAPANKQLYDTIVALDKIFWEAYNKGDTNTIINFMTDDHEFYHDQGGAIFSKEKNAIQWRKFYSKDLGVVGETVIGTNEIYEIPNYGALQLSYQRFYEKEKPEWTSPARAIVLWKKTSKGWLQSRVFSLH